jgi:hypothetical protein
MRLTLEQRQKKEAEITAKAERAWERHKSRIRKLAKNAEISFIDGWVHLTFPNGQIFKCRGKAVDEVFGTVEE